MITCPTCRASLWPIYYHQFSQPAASARHVNANVRMQKGDKRSGNILSRPSSYGNKGKGQYVWDPSCWLWWPEATSRTSGKDWSALALPSPICRLHRNGWLVKFEEIQQRDWSPRNTSAGRRQWDLVFRVPCPFSISWKKISSQYYCCDLCFISGMETKCT